MPSASTPRLARSSLAREPGDTLANQVRRRIADDVLGGRWAPGARLDEVALAESLGVSRTPVREALRDLASSGLVEIRPHRGAIVVAIDDQRLAALMEAVGEIDALCARLAARRMTLIERHALQSLHDAAGREARRGDRQAYAALNRQLHDLITDGSHNPVLATTAHGCRVQSSPFRRAQLERPGRLRQSHAEHDAVVRAIVTGDGEAAHHAMKEHLAAAGVGALASLAGLKELARWKPRP